MLLVSSFHRLNLMTCSVSENQTERKVRRTMRKGYLLLSLIEENICLLARHGNLLLSTVKPVLRPNIVFQDRLPPNAGQKYCRMLQ